MEETSVVEGETLIFRGSIVEVSVFRQLKSSPLSLRAAYYCLIRSTTRGQAIIDVVEDDDI